MRYGEGIETQGVDKQKSALKQNLEDELDNLKNENSELIDQFEQTITRANTLEVQAEIARLEFNQVFNAIDDAIWIISNNKKVLRVNSPLLDLLNLENKEQAIGRKCHELINSDLCHTEKCPLSGTHRNIKRLELDIEIDRENDEKVAYWLTITPLLGVVSETIGIVEQFKDITERKHYESELETANLKLERLATLDGLTQLANRRFFDETLRREWSRARREKQPLSLIMCDVDFFKLYNDHYGHQKGDECLQTLAQCMQNCLQRAADFIARYGGEEFVIVLPNTDSDGAQKVAENLRNTVLSLKREHIHSKVSDYVTLSFGVATVVPGQDGIDPKDLIKSADESLYVSKRTSRNTVTVKDLDNSG